MEQTGRRHHSGEHSFNRIHVDTFLEIRERPIGENKADVEPDQRTAPSEDKAHEAADRLVLFDAIAIVDPDERKVLHVVEHFE